MFETGFNSKQSFIKEFTVKGTPHGHITLFKTFFEEDFFRLPRVKLSIIFASRGVAEISIFS